MSETFTMSMPSGLDGPPLDLRDRADLPAEAYLAGEADILLAEPEAGAPGLQL